MAKLSRAFLPLKLTVLLGLCLPGSTVLGADHGECLLRSIHENADSLTIGELKAACRAGQTTSSRQIDQEHPLPKEGPAPEGAGPNTHANGFSVTPHRQNFILLYSHNSAPNTAPYPHDADTAVDHDEITFQVSLKFPIGSFQIGHHRTYLMAAYTAQSFWQAYNKTLSSPFRETNHEPEVFAVYPLDLKIPGARKVYLMGGFVHQSNGRSQPLSRSWNRLYLDFVIEGDNFKISLKPWYRIPEEDKGYIGASEGDDNPDISDYLGYGEISGAYRVEDHTFSFMLRNNLARHDNKGALRLGWSFKMPFIESNNLKGYIHYFNGYGESLIDYNAAVQRLGIGLMLADWF